ncbi:MAG TPA: DUF3592 domain-containing protein [Hyphomicrobiaceae bacterium]|nr:DUF3592 domain-containing protein [Hyphomicrobiaceae bacterium]
MAGNTALGVLATALIAGPYLWNWLSLPRLRLDSFPMPTAFDSIPARLILGFFTLCVLVFAIAAGVKSWEVRKAARWSIANGRIVRSEQAIELVRRGHGEMPVNTRVAKIAYEFEAGGRTLRGTRFTLGEITPESEVAGILARYPLNAPVDVYYDPENPAECTLERDPPEGILKGCLILLAYGIVGVLGLMWLVSGGARQLADMLSLSDRLPGAFLPVVGMAGFAGLFLLGFFLAIEMRQRRARQWPKTTGEVVLSTIHEYYQGSYRTETPISVARSKRRGYMPIVEYTYKVMGRPYSSRHIQIESQTAGSRSYAESVIARYGKGQVVTVHYNPEQPSQAALELGGRLHYVLLVLGALLMLFALNAAGILGDSIFVPRR